MKKKILVTSILTIALCLSLIAGSTFALFTSKSSVNIAVTSGKVSVVATIDKESLEKGSTLGSMLDETSITVSEEDNTVTLENIVPGDYVNFNLIVTNNSNVSVKYRVVIYTIEDTGLFKGLTVKIDGAAYDGSTKYSNWTLLNPESETVTVPVSISLPEEAGNEYQAKSCKLAYVVEAVQGNASVVDPYTYDEESKTYIINDETGMMLMSGIIGRVSHGEGRVLKFALNADMNMSGKEWTPLTAHWVNIDGNGHKISNLNCGTESWGRSGFLGYAGGAVVSNLTLENVTAEGTQAGVVAGSLEYVTLTDVVIKGTNTVSYNATKNPEEEWGGVGAVAGVAQAVNTPSNVTIAEGATVTVVYNNLVTKSVAQNEYAFINDISDIVTNNGTVTKDGSFASMRTDANGVEYIVDETGTNYLYYIPTDYTDTTFTVSEGVQAIYQYAGYYNQNIKEFIVPGTVKLIGTRADGGPNNIFKGNTSIERIEIEDGVETIAIQSFQQMKALKTVIVHSGEILDGAFRDCPNLEYVEIGENVTVINQFAFRTCAALKTVVIKSENVTFGSGSMVFSKKDTGVCDNITVYVPNETVKTSLLAASTSCHGLTIVVGSVASSPESLNEAIKNGDDIILTEDIACTTKLGNDGPDYSPYVSTSFNMDLGEKTLALTGLENKFTNNIKLSNGVVDVTKGCFDSRSTESREIVVEGVTFDNVNGASSLSNAFIYTPEANGVKSTFVFKNCVFNNCNIKFQGLSNYSDCGFTATFEGCEFNQTVDTWAFMFIEVGHYLKGEITIKDCTFNFKNQTSGWVMNYGGGSDASLKVTFDGENVVKGGRGVLTGSTPDEVIGEEEHITKN